MAECLLPSGNNNAMPIKIINFFISKGLTPNQALGICANVFGESGYRTTPVNSSSGAYGLFQWTGSRKSALSSYCQKNGYSMSDATAQLNFAWHENDRNVWQKYASNRGMSAMQSLDYWEDNWERCFNSTGTGSGCKTSKEVCCHHSDRIKELNRLTDLYKNNVKSSNCGVSVGESGGEEVSGGCDPTSMAYSDGGTVDGSGETATASKSSVKTSENSYNPTNSNKTNTKPVLFGGKWAYKMSPYFTGNGDFYAYTSWGGVLGDSKKSTDSKSFMGTYVNKVNVSSTNKTIDHIKRYLSYTQNKPKCIVVTLDSPTITIPKKNPQRSDIIKGMKTAFIKFLTDVNASYSTTIIIPLRIDSWDNLLKFNNGTCTYEDFNEAVRQAAACFWNVRTVETPEFNKGDKKPSNGILPEDVWSKYANEVKVVARSVK